MGKKNKSKKGKGIERTLKKTQRKLEKKSIILEMESGQKTIENLLEEYHMTQRKITEVVTRKSAPPSPRSHFTLTAVPDSNELILYGGEFYDGKKITLYSDLYAFDCKEKCWTIVQSPNAPPPRSGHQAVLMKTSTIPTSIWIFGGEYASPTQVRFHHYQDFWCLRVRNRRWESIQCERSVSPCARSGHRMIAWKDSILMFGGFSDTGSQTLYFNDLWCFDIASRFWTALKLEGDVPPVRSGCLLLPGNDMKTLYIVGGYRKERVSRDVERGVALSDYYRVQLEKKIPFGKSVLVRASGVKPRPPRSGLACAMQSANCALVFGGVNDVESECGESVIGHFHNDLFTLEVDKARWHFFNYATAKSTVESTNTAGIQADSVTRSSNLNYPLSARTLTVDSMSSLTIDDAFLRSSTSQPSGSACMRQSSGDVSSHVPSARSGAGMTVMGSSLYIYGGVFEVGDRKITLDDFYCLDLSNPYSWHCLYPGTQAEQEWYGSDLEEDDDEAESNSSQSCSEGMDIDEESDSDEDDEIVEEAQPVLPMETYASYWSRTSDFWYNLVAKGLQSASTSQTTSASSPDPSISALAKRLATDFFHKRSNLSV